MSRSPHPRQGRRKLALLDVDGTLTRERSIWQYVMEQHGCWAGTGEENLRRFLAGQVSYEEFCHLDAELLAGVEYAYLQAIAHRVPKHDGLDELFGCLTERGYAVALVSTGLRLLTSYFSERYQVDLCIANDLVAEGGVCTGKALISIGEHEKGRLARQAIEQFTPSYVLAIGDSTGDLPLFEVADLAISVNATNPRVLAASDVKFTGTDLSELCELL